MDPADELVTIARYPFRSTAEGLRIGLEAQGIPAVVTDLRVPVGWLWLLNDSAQWAELQVLKSQAERAGSILSEVEGRRMVRRWRHRARTASKSEDTSMPDTDHIDDLESQLYGLRLQVATLYRILIAKGVATSDELQALMEKVDAADGARDGEYFGDIMGDTSSES